jgi:alpha-1,6-mannosyltransferase
MALAALGVANALLLVWGGAQDDSSARQLAATLGAAALGSAVLLWLALDIRFERVPLRWVFALALLLRVIAAFAQPLLEDDHHRYLWDGWRTATALDPYRLPPSAWFGDTNLPQRWQDVLGAINHPDIPTIYGPVLQALFALGHAIAPAQLWPLQAMLVGADIAVLWLLARQGVGVRWLLAYAMHPLLLKEGIASAHPDVLVALFLLLTLAAWQRGHPVLVGVLLGLAVGTKVAALVVAPLLLWAPMLACAGEPRDALRWALSVAAAAAATVPLLYLPLLMAGGSDATALSVFGTTWRFNPLLYRVVEAVLPAAHARPAAALLIITGIGVIAWRWRQQVEREPNAPPPLDAALVLLLLLSPVVNPWYWLWVLALAVSMRRASLVAISAVSALSYFNSSVVTALADLPPFIVPWPLALAQGVVFLAAWRAQISTQARTERIGARDARGVGGRRLAERPAQSGLKPSTPDSP